MFVVKLPGRLLSTRITLLVLGMILLGLWALALHTTVLLRQDAETQAAKQQATAAAMIAARVNGELNTLLSVLEQLVRDFGEYSPRNAAHIKELVGRYMGASGVFNAGLLLVSMDGTIEAGGVPDPTQACVFLPDRELLARLAKQGIPLVSGVFIGSVTGAPVYDIGVPVRNHKGEVVAALFGRVRMENNASVTEHNPLQGLDNSQVNYLIVSPQSRLVFVASDHRRIGERWPDAGKDFQVDALFRDTDFSGRVLTVFGQAYLVSSREVSLTGWQVIIMQPLNSVLALFLNIRQHLWINTLLLTVLIGGVLWWQLRSQLKPLEETSKTLAAMTDLHQPLLPLPVVRQDEIGVLISSFNRLMNTLGHRESELRESESRYRMLFDEMLDAFSLYEVVSGENGKPDNFRLLSGNPTFIRMNGLRSEQEIVGLYIDEIFPDSFDLWLNAFSQVILSGNPATFEFEFYARRNKRKLEVKVFRPTPGQVACIFADITERKQAEEAQRRSEESFRNLFEKNSTVMLMVDPESGNIIEANAAAVAYYGYSEVQLKGMPMSEINDMSVERIEAEGMRSLSEAGDFYQLVHRLASGELRDVEVHLSPIETENRTLLFSIVHDVTERRKAEQKLAVLAQVDTLTGLANRRYFLENAERELSKTHRYGGTVSVLMMDIDYFKKVNDSYGHHAGDLVLQAVGQLFLKTLRHSDFVGRIGGEEFAVILPQTDAERALELAVRLRQMVESAEIARGEGTPLRVTISIGVTTLGQMDNTNLDTLISQADSALYEAKRNGRNRVCTFTPVVEAA